MNRVDDFSGHLFDLVLFQLPSGRTAHISLEQVLNLTEEGIQYMVASGVGDDINNPFHGSALADLAFSKREIPDDYEAGVDINELCSEDQVELSSIAGMSAIFDDGDYLGDFED